MIRVKRGSVANKRRRKILRMSRGFQSPKSFKLLNQKILKANTTAYRNRKKCKQLFRNLWIQRINSGLRVYGVSFSKFIHLCKHSKIQLNRKIISQLIIYESSNFFLEFKSSFNAI